MVYVQSDLQRHALVLSLKVVYTTVHLQLALKYDSLILSFEVNTDLAHHHHRRQLIYRETRQSLHSSEAIKSALLWLPAGL